MQFYVLDLNGVYYGVLVGCDHVYAGGKVGVGYAYKVQSTKIANNALEQEFVGDGVAVCKALTKHAYVLVANVYIAVGLGYTLVGKAGFNSDQMFDNGGFGRLGSKANGEAGVGCPFLQCVLIGFGDKLFLHFLLYNLAGFLQVSVLHVVALIHYHGYGAILADGVDIQNVLYFLGGAVTVCGRGAVIILGGLSYNRGNLYGLGSIPGPLIGGLTLKIRFLGIHSIQRFCMGFKKVDCHCLKFLSL